MREVRTRDCRRTSGSHQSIRVRNETITPYPGDNHSEYGTDRPFRNDLHHGYSEDFQKLLRRRNAQSNAAHLLPHLEPGLQVLDLGCGPGTISVGLAQAVAPGEVHGVDVEASQIDLAGPPPPTVVTAMPYSRREMRRRLTLRTIPSISCIATPYSCMFRIHRRFWRGAPGVKARRYPLIPGPGRRFIIF